MEYPEKQETPEISCERTDNIKSHHFHISTHFIFFGTVDTNFTPTLHAFKRNEQKTTNSSSMEYYITESSNAKRSKKVYQRLSPRDTLECIDNVHMCIFHKKKYQFSASS